MDDLMALANHPPEDVDPLVLASIIAFGFVSIHPFMDGNGRLSRFLFHQVLCERGALQNGLVLPVSIVMRQNETDYLSVLQTSPSPLAGIGIAPATTSFTAESIRNLTCRTSTSRGW